MAFSSKQFLQLWITALEDGLSKEEFFEVCFKANPDFVCTKEELTTAQRKDSNPNPDPNKKILSKLYYVRSLYYKKTGMNLATPKSSNARNRDNSDQLEFNAFVEAVRGKAIPSKWEEPKVERAKKDKPAPAE